MVHVFGESDADKLVEMFMDRAKETGHGPRLKGN